MTNQTIAVARAAAAFEDIFRTYSDYVYSLALRMVRSRDDAKDVTQEVFMAVYHNLSGFRGDAKMKTWLYRITLNHCLNRLRKESMRSAATVPFDDAIEHPPAADEHQRQKNIVARLLDVLTPEQRACVILKNIEGLSYAEIAQTLRIGINTVRSRLKRAREKMLSQRKEVMAHEV